jgi:N-acetylmuramoyl-L-alanine amidase
VYLGEWAFTAAQPAVIELSNQSAPGNVVIADAVKLGAGMGSIVRGAGVSGRARWQECSRYWAQYAGAPASVYDTATGQDNSDDVTARPRLMNWWGGFDLYFSLHSNASTGSARGTVTLSYDNSGSTQHPTALLNESVAFRDRMNAQVAGDMTAAHDSTWVTRNPYGGSFGELRMSTTAPSCLLESAFHDNATDASYLRDPISRHTIGRAAYKAIVRQLNPSATILPLPPTHMAMRNTAAGQVTISWQPQADPLEASAVATGYRVYLSSDGFAFDSGRDANAGTSHTLNVSPGEMVFAKVTATNAGGESLASEVMCARAPDAQAQGLATPLLIVSGYDRLDEFTWYQQGATVHTGNMHMRNWRDSVRRHALAAANASTAGGGSFFFDGAANECVISGSVDLSDYAAVNWVLGNESTADATFDADERAAVQALLAAGGRLFVSGGDVGFATDAAFLGDLGAGFVNTSSGVWTGSDVAGGVFDGVGAFSIDNGTGNNYTVLSPDVLSAGTGAASALTYTGGAVAAIETANTIVIGFPFECINEEVARNAVMQATLTHVLPGYTGINTNPPPSTGNGGGSDSSGCAVSPLSSVPVAFGLLAIGLLGLRRRAMRI